MNKEETLKALEDAKRSHIEQMGKIVQLLSKKQILDPTPLNKKECEFGKIFYGNRETFYTILGAQFYEKLDFLHERWHKDYAKINVLFFQENKNGLFSKLLGANKIDPLAYDKAKLYYVELKSITDELLRVLDISLRRVEALNDSKFKN